MIIGMLMHGVIWGPLGAAAGLAIAIGMGEPRLIGRAMVAGLVGAVVGGVAFDLVGAFAFPLAKTDSPISQTWATRLLARLLVTVGTAACLATVARARRISVPTSRRRDRRLRLTLVAGLFRDRRPMVGPMTNDH